MKHSPIKFICTGMCGEDHPVNDHCRDCHHAEFKTTATTDSGQKITVWMNMLHGPSFAYQQDEKMFYPEEHDPIWKFVEEVCAFAQRNCAKWKGKK